MSLLPRGRLPVAIAATLIAVLAVAAAATAVPPWRAFQDAEGTSPPGDELKRRGFLGTAIAPVEGGEGVLVQEVLPGSTAEDAGLARGDLILAVDDDPVSSPAAFVERVGLKRAGDAIALRLRRDGEERTEELTLKAREPEVSETGEVVYGSIPADAGRLRTIVTRPEGDGPFPALFLIQGLGCASVDNPSGGLAPYKAIVDAFTDAGFVTLRVEKPGCGDSEGGPCPDVDFDTELDGYLRGLRALKAMPGVDPDRVLIFGHSMGGVMGPLIAAEEPVAGLAAYGTVVKTWMEYCLENVRRQAVLGGADLAEVDETLRDQADLFARLFLLGQEPREAVAGRPGLASALAEIAPDGEHIYTRNARFFHQLASRNLPAAWVASDCPALAIWGEADFVSSREDHELIAAIVEDQTDHPGRFVLLEGTDHGFALADSYEDTLAREGAGTFNPELLRVLLDWAGSVVDPAG